MTRITSEMSTEFFRVCLLLTSERNVIKFNGLEKVYTIEL